MSAGAAEWVWANSRAANGPLLVLMAIAFAANEKGECDMSIAELARKARLSDRAVQLATPALVALGEVEVELRVAAGNRNRYRLPLLDHGRTGEESSPVKNLHGEDSSPLPRIVHRPAAPPDEPKPQATTRAGAESSPVGPVDNFSDVLDLSSVVSGGKSKSKSREESQPPRDDVERLCAHLADRIEANGSKRPNIDKRWRDSARRMIDIDGRDEEKAHALIDWCQQDYFWRQNIHSMPTFRRQYDKLRLAAIAEWEKKKHRGTLQPGAAGHPRQVSYSDEEYTRGWQ